MRQYLLILVLLVLVIMGVTYTAPRSTESRSGCQFSYGEYIALNQTVSQTYKFDSGMTYTLSYDGEQVFIEDNLGKVKKAVTFPLKDNYLPLEDKTTRSSEIVKLYFVRCEENFYIRAIRDEKPSSV